MYSDAGKIKLDCAWIDNVFAVKMTSPDRG